MRRSTRLTAGAVLCSAAVAVAVAGGAAAAGPGPLNAAAPRISGTAQQGLILTARPGHWQSNGRIDYSFQWQHCDSGGANCASIQNATDIVYIADSQDLGSTLKVLVTATGANSASSQASSDPTAQVQPSSPDVAKSLAPPEIAGTVREGDVLTGKPGTWTGPQPIKFGFRWRLCDANGGDCANTSATGLTYSLTSREVGRQLRLLVEARIGGARRYALSGPSGLVKARGKAPSLTSKPSISGHATVGSVLTINPGGWAGDQPIRLAYQWQRCNPDGSGCQSIGGETFRQYTLHAEDAGHRLRAVVLAENAVGKTFAVTGFTEVVPPVATPPQNTSTPAISGAPQEGSTLTAQTGNWNGASQFSFRWRRCDSVGNSCTDIATGRTYTLNSNDVGHAMRVVVTATNGTGSNAAVSAPTAVVKARPAAAPQNTGPPSISGTPQDGGTLTAQPGAWSGAPQFAFRWRRCDGSGNGCTDVATGQTYTLTGNDVTHTLRVVVTATNSGGSNAVVSAPTAVIVPRSPSGGGGNLPAGAIKLANGTTSIPVSSVSLPQRLIVDQIQASPNPIQSHDHPLVVRFRVIDSRGFVVRDALVFALGVPFDRLSPEPEAVSGEDGWATVSFQILPTFELKHGNLVVIFVRARKAGENLLAGVSTRRLVSVRVA